MFAKTAALLAFVAIATATDINVSDQDHGMPRTASPRRHWDEPSNFPTRTQITETKEYLCNRKKNKNRCN